MFTVADLLAMPLFAEANLVTGESGLDRTIQRVHVVDVPEPMFDWVQGGELVLTNGYALPHTASEQQRYVQRLFELNLAGMVISVGQYLPQTPDGIRQAAVDATFPIIELPSHVSFADIIRDVMARIIDEQYTLNQRASEIHDKLMRLVLDGKALQHVAAELADIIQRSITIEDTSLRVLATAERGEVDTARTRSVELGQTSPQLAKALIERGIYKRLLSKRSPVYVPPMHEIGMDMERIVAPIIVANQITGFVWIIAGARRLDSIDRRAIETASLVTALIMMRERSIREKELALREDFLTKLLISPSAADPEFVDLAHRNSFQMNVNYQVVVIEGSHSEVENDPRGLQQRVEQHVNGRTLIAQRDNRLVIVVQSQRTPNGVQIAETVFKALNHPTEVLRVGVGMQVEHMNAVRASFESAIDVIEIMEKRGVLVGVWTFDDLGVLHWLKQLDPAVLAQNRYYRLVSQLAAADADLCRTLEVYLQQDKNVGVTAHLLDIHRNTLTYRLRRIEEWLGAHLDDAELCVNLHIALKAYRLHIR